MAAEDQFLLLPSVASFRQRPPTLGSSSSSSSVLAFLRVLFWVLGFGFLGF
jgi:hypothetical protein